MRTRELVRQLKLDPNVEWRRGWKVLIKQTDKKGRVVYLSCAAPQPLEYEVGKMRCRFLDDGPLAGWRYKRDAVMFKEAMEDRYGFANKKIHVLFPMLYIQANSYIEQGMVRIAVWQGIDAAGRPIRGREISKMPKGTVYAATIVVYGEEVEI